jgi:ABC-type multidrug transport system permease subunit
MQGLLTFPMWEAKVECQPHEYGLFDPPAGLTCGQYLAPFVTYATGYINNPNATAACEYCGYRTGAEYLATMNITAKIDGWKGILITL